MATNSHSLLNKHGKRPNEESQSMNYAGHDQKRAQISFFWSCSRCTLRNDERVNKCGLCGEIKPLEFVQKQLQQSNPYFAQGGVFNIPKMPSMPSMSAMTNIAPNMANMIPPNMATVPPNMANISSKASALTLPSLHNKSNTDTYAIPTNESMANLHPSLLQNINGSTEEFKKSVNALNVKSKDQSVAVSDNKTDEWEASNIGTATDWASLSNDVLLDTFGKSLTDSDIDRLYYALQKYRKEKPKGPFSGSIFWKKIAQYCNSSRTATSWKTHFNNYTKTANKSKHRWNQLCALKALFRQIRSKKSVNNQLSLLQNYTESQKKKRDKALLNKKAEQQKTEDRQSKMDKLLDLAISNEEKKVSNTDTIQPLQDLKPAQTQTMTSTVSSVCKSVSTPSVSSVPTVSNTTVSTPSVSTMNSDNGSIKVNKKWNLDSLFGTHSLLNFSESDEETVSTVKDLLDDLEDNELFTSAELEPLKGILYLDDSKATTLPKLIKEYRRLESKYYDQREKIVSKLIKNHKFFK